MNKKFYIIIPVIAFSIIFVNAFFGHLLFEIDSEKDLNKYSIYVHFLDDWKSYPRNIIFEVTTAWENPEININDPYYEPELDVQLKTEYNVNELQFVNEKALVELKHEFSDCKNEWRPILYRQAVDTLRAQFSYLSGEQTNSDPYVVQYPKIQNLEYSESEQELKLQSGYSHFIPVCTAKDSTSYEFSVKTNDEKLAFDVYFVPSMMELENYRETQNFEYYEIEGCFGRNFQSFSGICENVSQESGLLILVPDDLNLSLTKISVHLNEKIN